MRSGVVDDVERTRVSDSPRAGLVMAAYNATAYLEKAIEGIATQDFADFACRIVDDGSTDGTADLARALTAHDSRFVVDEVAHGGQSIARNVGVSRLPMTQYLSFPDADDEWHPDALGALIGAADAFGGVGAHALATRIDPDGNPFDDGAFTRYGRDRVMFRGLRKQLVPVHLPSSFETLLCTCTVYPPGVWTVRRDVFDQIGGFDPSLFYFEDWDLQIRASRLGRVRLFGQGRRQLSTAPCADQRQSPGEARHRRVAGQDGAISPQLQGAVSSSCRTLAGQ